jgi:hypothetical protein
MLMSCSCSARSPGIELCSRANPLSHSILYVLAMQCHTQAFPVNLLRTIGCWDKTKRPAMYWPIPNQRAKELRQARGEQR